MPADQTAGDTQRLIDRRQCAVVVRQIEHRAANGADMTRAEVQSHLDATSVRAIALQGTPGLSHGAPTLAVGGPLTAPVGDTVLGRLLDVGGAVHDHGSTLHADTLRAVSAQAVTDSALRR